jgi:hypothetical protein
MTGFRDSGNDSGFHKMATGGKWRNVRRYLHRNDDNSVVGRWNYNYVGYNHLVVNRQNCSHMEAKVDLFKRPRIIMNLRGRNKVSAEFNMSSDRYCFLITHILYADQPW